MKAPEEPAFSFPCRHMIPFGYSVVEKVKLAARQSSRPHSLGVRSSRAPEFNAVGGEMSHWSCPGGKPGREVRISSSIGPMCFRTLACPSPLPGLRSSYAFLSCSRCLAGPDSVSDVFAILN